MKKLISLSIGSLLLLTSTRCSDNNETDQQKGQQQIQPQPDGSPGGVTPSGKNITTTSKTPYALAQSDLDCIQGIVFKDKDFKYQEGFSEFADNFSGTAFKDADKVKVKPIQDAMNKVRHLKVGSAKAEIEAIANDLEAVIKEDNFTTDVHNIFDDKVKGGIPAKMIILLKGLSRLKDKLEAEAKKA